MHKDSREDRVEDLLEEGSLARCLISIERLAPVALASLAERLEDAAATVPALPLLRGRHKRIIQSGRFNYTAAAAAAQRDSLSELTAIPCHFGFCNSTRSDYPYI